MNTILTDGLCARPVTMEDLEPMVEMFNDFSESQIGMRLATVNGIRTEWVAPIMNLQTNTMAVFTDAGRPVGYMEFWDVNEPHVSFFLWSAIHPEYWGRGIGSYLVEWGVERARQNVHLAPEGARVVIDLYAEAANQSARDLLTHHGFQDIRSSYWMRVDFEQPPQPPAPIPGITIRPMRYDDELRATLHAANESFKDHWGHVDEPFEDYYQRELYFINQSTVFDPQLWFLAMDGEEIAGVSLCRSYLDGSPNLGWVNTLGVRRPWRKRGIGLALLQHSFYELHRRGRTAVALGVDASSLTGATRLYEKAGMRVVRKSTLYQMELRPGIDLRTNAIAEE